jgi:uncharacterized protein YraI
MRSAHLLLAFAGVLAAQAAARAQTAIKATGTVNVRTGPGTGYGIIGQVPGDHVYVGFERSGDWWKIWYNGGTGWTHASYYTTLSGVTGVKVTTDTLNVRSGPSTGYAILGKVYMGQIHFWTAHASISPWYKIYWGGGTGYLHGDYVTQVALSGGSATPPPTGTPSNLAMTHQYQVTNYFCGPATAQMVVAYLTGTWVSQYTIASYCGTSPTYGTSLGAVKNAIVHYSGHAYVSAYGFDRSRAVANIQAYRPVPINIQCRYLAYWGYSWAMHHSPIKGFTSGGFYIHDSWTGPNEWASSTEVWNAVNYHYGLYALRY